MVSIYADSVSLSQTVTLQDGEDMRDLIQLVNFQPFSAAGIVPDFAYIVDASIELNFNPGVDVRVNTGAGRTLAFDFGFEYFVNSINIESLVGEESRFFGDGYYSLTGFGSSKADFFIGGTGQFEPVLAQGSNGQNYDFVVQGTQTFDVTITITFIGREP